MVVDDAGQRSLEGLAHLSVGARAAPASSFRAWGVLLAGHPRPPRRLSPPPPAVRRPRTGAGHPLSSCRGSGKAKGGAGKRPSPGARGWTSTAVSDALRIRPGRDAQGPRWERDCNRRSGAGDGGAGGCGPDRERGGPFRGGRRRSRAFASASLALCFWAAAPSAASLGRSRLWGPFEETFWTTTRREGPGVKGIHLLPPPQCRRGARISAQQERNLEEGDGFIFWGVPFRATECGH